MPHPKLLKPKPQTLSRILMGFHPFFGGCGLLQQTALRLPLPLLLMHADEKAER